MIFRFVSAFFTHAFPQLTLLQAIRRYSQEIAVINTFPTTNIRLFEIVAFIMEHSLY
jgi:hypothetical protein